MLLTVGNVFDPSKRTKLGNIIFTHGYAFVQLYATGVSKFPDCY